MGYIGIDLGTTNSVGAVFNTKTEEIEIVKIEGIDEILPSVVCYQNDEIIVGNEAKAGAIIYPETTIISIKRKMGDSEPIILPDREVTPEEVSAEILKKIKDAAQEQFSEEYDEVVITHPAYFNDTQIYATKKAGELAGFKQVHLISEPLAAAIEYGFKQGYAQTVMVYDLGGGTFDACVLKVSKNIYGQEIFQELADIGDMNLGGDDFDQEIITVLINQFQNIHHISIETLSENSQKQILQKLKYEAEQVKFKLSSTQKATVRIAPLAVIDSVPYSLEMDITREDFESLIKKYVDKSRSIVEEALKRAKLDAQDLSKIILVGGSTIVPLVKRMIAGTLKEPYRASDPAKSVAIGAAIYNYLIHLPNASVQIGQITRQHIGTEAITDMVTKQRNLIPIIPMGSPIPTSVSDNHFTTSNQSGDLIVDLFQWEDGKELDRKYIGNIEMKGLAAKTQLELTYSINEDNLFEVSLKDLTTFVEMKGVFDREKPQSVFKKSLDMPLTEGINCLFVIDTTGSMDTYLDGVKDRAILFSNTLQEKKIDYQLGLIGFGDLGEKEKPTVYKFTKDVLRFQKQVKKIKRTYGGDIPESSLDAIETAVYHFGKSKIEATYQKVIILITDAPPHIPTETGKQVGDLVELLKEQGIICFVVAGKDRESLAAYEPLTKHKGHYYSMTDDFYDILNNIAVSITELVRMA